MSSTDTTKKRATIEGRLYQGVLVADHKRARYTVAELKALELCGKPLLFEHDEEVGQIGTITSNRVDGDGWLWITASLFSPEDLGGEEALPAQMRDMLRSGYLRDLSIGYHAPLDEQTGRCGTKTFDEASLVRRGKYKGTSLMRVQASSFRRETESTTTATSIPRKPMDSSDILEVKAFAVKMGGRELTQADFEGKTKSALIMELAMESAEEKATLSKQLTETKQIAQEYNERVRQEQAPKAERFMATMQKLGVKENETVVAMRDAFGDRQSLPVASVLDTLVSGYEASEKSRAEIEQKLADFEKRAAEAEAKYKQQLLSTVANGSSSSSSGTAKRERAPDGKFTSCAQEAAAEAAGGGSGGLMMERATGSSSSSSEGKMARSVGSSFGGSDEADRIRSLARRNYPAAFVGADANSNSTWWERASNGASLTGSDAGRLGKDTLDILRRITAKPRDSQF